MSLNATSQTGTFAKTYGVSNITPGGILVKSIIYGNSLFSVYNEAGLGLMVQKNDLNGVPVLKRAINGVFPSPSTSFYLNTSGGNLYISGSKTASAVAAFVIKIDTATCNYIYSNQYTLPTLNMFRVYDSKILNNGELLLAGSATNSGSMTVEYGILMTVMTTSGSAMVTRTVTVNSSTNTVIGSITQISNSSVLFVANTNGVPNICKAIGISGNFSVVSAYAGIPGALKISAFGNAKKFLAMNSTHIYKVDTNMALMISPQPGVNLAGSATPYYLDNKIYRLYGGTKVDIIDTGFVLIGSNNYTSAITSTLQYAQGIIKNNNNLFINYSASSTSDNFCLLKTALNGTMNCSTTETNNPVSSPINGGSVTITSGFDNPMSIPTSPNSPTMTVTYTNSCLNTGVEEVFNKNKIKTIYTEGYYILTSDKNFSTFQLIDLTGRMIRNEKMSGNNDRITIQMNTLPDGIYIARIMDVDQNEYTIKLIK